jgi:hypothetical protein
LAPKGQVDQLVWLSKGKKSFAFGWRRSRATAGYAYGRRLPLYHSHHLYPDIIDLARDPRYKLDPGEKMTIATPCYTAFGGARRLASGSLPEVTLAIKARLRRTPTVPVLVFDDSTGRVIDLDLRGSDGAAVRRLESHPVHSSTASSEPAQRGRGRPKLGVVAREVTLLPRHWDWLNAQPGGASVALRRLVDEARRVNRSRDRVRRAQEAAYRFMSAMAGNEPGYEEAIRALFAGDRGRFDLLIGKWPTDVRDYAAGLAEAAFVDHRVTRGGH